MFGQEIMYVQTLAQVSSKDFVFYFSALYLMGNFAFFKSFFYSVKSIDKIYHKISRKNAHDSKMFFLKLLYKNYVKFNAF